MQEKLYGIYKITSPSGRVYIGQAINIKKRIQSYKCCKKDQELIYNSLLKYGYDKHQFEILFNEILNKEEVNKKEIELIKIYKDLKISLNIQDGGNQNRNPKYYIAVVRLDLNNNYIDEFNSISEAAKFCNIRDSTISWCILEKGLYTAGGYFWLRREDYLNGKIPRKIPTDTNKKPIIQLDLEGNFIKEWDSTIDISNNLLIHKSTISAAVNYSNGRNYSNGFLWVKKENYEKGFIPKGSRKIENKVYQYDLKKNFIKEYTNPRECIKYNSKISKSVIYGSLSGKYKNPHKFIFTYEKLH